MSQTYGDGSYIQGSGSALTAFFADGTVSQPWGIYNLQIGEDPSYQGFGSEYYTGSGEPADLSGRRVDMGGVSDFYYTPGMWIGGLENTIWAAGEIRGDLNGRYLTQTEMGTLGGPFYGLYDPPDAGGHGYWIGTGVGTYTGTPLAFSGFAESSLRYAEDGDGVWLAEGSYLQGLLGGLQNPLREGIPTPITIMGSSADDGYTNFNPQGAYLMSSPYAGISGVVGPGISDGAFNGYFIGNWRNGEIDGRLVSIYLKPGSSGQDAGLLSDSRSASLRVDPTGQVTVDPAAAGIPGTYYPGTGMWETAGNIVAGPIVGSTAVTAVALAEDPYATLTSESFSSGSGAGEFTGGATLEVDDLTGSTLRLVDQDWGIWNLGLAGHYDFAGDYDQYGNYVVDENSVAANWQVAVGGDYQSESGGFWLGKISGDSWDPADIHGTYAGVAATVAASYRFSG
jgi:hypothetical protein